MRAAKRNTTMRLRSRRWPQAVTSNSLARSGRCAAQEHACRCAAPNTNATHAYNPLTISRSLTAAGHASLRVHFARSITLGASLADAARAEIPP